jgi:hypothetical protein
MLAPSTRGYICCSLKASTGKRNQTDVVIEEDYNQGHTHQRRSLGSYYRMGRSVHDLRAETKEQL